MKSVKKISNQHFFWGSQSGASILSLLIGIGVSAVVLFGVTELIQQGMKQQQRVDIAATLDTFQTLGLNLVVKVEIAKHLREHVSKNAPLKSCLEGNGINCKDGLGSTWVDLNLPSELAHLQKDINSYYGLNLGQCVLETDPNCVLKRSVQWKPHCENDKRCGGLEIRLESSYVSKSGEMNRVNLAKRMNIIPISKQVLGILPVAGNCGEDVAVSVDIVTGNFVCEVVKYNCKDGECTPVKVAQVDGSEESYAFRNLGPASSSAKRKPAFNIGTLVESAKPGECVENCIGGFKVYTQDIVTTRTCEPSGSCGVFEPISTITNDYCNTGEKTSDMIACPSPPTSTEPVCVKSPDRHVDSVPKTWDNEYFLRKCKVFRKNGTCKIWESSSDAKSRCWVDLPVDWCSGWAGAIVNAEKGFTTCCGKPGRVVSFSVVDYKIKGQPGWDCEPTCRCE